MKPMGKIFFLLGSVFGLVALSSISANSPDVAKVTVLVVAGVLICAALFIRNRVKEGVGLVEAAEKEQGEVKKEQGDVEKKSNELTLRNLFARLLGTFGMLFMTVAIGSPFYGDKSGHLKFGVAMFVALCGVFFVLCAAFLVRAPVFASKPPLWFPAVAGFVCSCCVLTFSAGMIGKLWAPKTKAMDWTDYTLLLSIPVGVTSAIICIIMAFGSLVRPKAGPDSRTSNAN